MTRYGLAAGRLGGFAVLPVVSALIPLVALPIVARSSSVDQWGAIAIGQSVGGLGSIVVGSGWNLLGPTQVARATPAERTTLVSLALVTRSLVYFLSVGPFVVAAFAIPGTRAHGLAAAMTATVMLTGFTVAWYAAGTGRPSVLAFAETLPRLAGHLIGAVVAASTGIIELYPCGVAIAAVLGLARFNLRHGARITGESVPESGRWLWRNKSAALIELVAAAYSVGAAGWVGLVGTRMVVAEFGSGYRVTSLGATSIGALSSSLLGWVASATGPAFRRRVWLSFRLHLALGVVGGLGLALVGRQITVVLFGARLATPAGTCDWLGVFFLLWSLETVTARHILVPSGAVRTVLWTTTIGSLIGCVLVPVGSSSFGSAGAAAGVAISLGCIVVLQIGPCVRVLRSRSIDLRSLSSSS